MALWGAITFGRKCDRGAELLALAEELVARGFCVAGFAQRVHKQEGVERATELVRLRRPERIHFGQSGPKSAEDGCSFVFNPEAFSQGRAWIKQDAAGAQVLLLHEIGKLELSGQGHAPCVVEALASPAQLVLLCTSGERLGQVVERFSPPGEPGAYIELPARKVELERFFSALSSALANDPALKPR